LAPSKVATFFDLRNKSVTPAGQRLDQTAGCSAWSLKARRQLFDGHVQPVIRNHEGPMAKAGRCNCSRENQLARVFQ